MNSSILKILHNVGNRLFSSPKTFTTYEGKFQKNDRESFLGFSKWTKKMSKIGFSKILYEKTQFVTIIEFYRKVAKKIILILSR